MAEMKRAKKEKERAECCCDFRVLAYGSSRCKITALNDQIDLQLSIDSTVAADCSSIGAVPPNPAASSSDSDGENKIVSRQLQGPDLIGKVDEYTVHWDVLNARLPAIVDIRLNGQAEAHMRCAAQSGHATFSDFNVKKQDDTTKGETKVTVTAHNDCESDTCRFTIREP